MTAPTDYKKLAEEALDLVQHDLEYYPTDSLTRIIYPLARALLAMDADQIEPRNQAIRDLSKALHQEHHGSGGHFDCDICSMIAEAASPDYQSSIEAENQRLRTANSTLLHERTLAYNDLTIANLEVRNLRERLAGGKLD